MPEPVQSLHSKLISGSELWLGGRAGFFAFLAPISHYAHSYRRRGGSRAGLANLAAYMERCMTAA